MFLPFKYIVINHCGNQRPRVPLAKQVASDFKMPTSPNMLASLTTPSWCALVSTDLHIVLRRARADLRYRDETLDVDVRPYAGVNRHAHRVETREGRPTQQG